MKTLKSCFTSFWLCLACQHRISCCLLKHIIALSLHCCDWLFPLSARMVSSGNRSNNESTQERVDCKGLWGRWRLHLMDSCQLYRQGVPTLLPLFYVVWEQLTQKILKVKCLQMQFPAFWRLNWVHARKCRVQYSSFDLSATQWYIICLQCY